MDHNKTWYLSIEGQTSMRSEEIGARPGQWLHYGLQMSSWSSASPEMYFPLACRDLLKPLCTWMSVVDLHGQLQILLMTGKLCYVHCLFMFQVLRWIFEAGTTERR